MKPRLKEKKEKENREPKKLTGKDGRQTNSEKDS
jgi:hypothetical protein